MAPHLLAVDVDGTIAVRGILPVIGDECGCTRTGDVTAPAGRIRPAVLAPAAQVAA